MRQRSWNFLFFSFVLLLSLTACSDNNSSENAADKMETTAEEVGDLFRTEQEELKHDMEEAQKSIELELKNLQMELAEATEDTKEELNKQIKSLEAQQKALAEDMEKLGDQMADNWNEFEADVKKRLDEINEELNSM